ncbi:Exodeoxyribonuclease V alpha chain [Candidatus Rubidus massiliensis]|nr:Exodeoxyribonuclease V alpha chain [Candidatus Rubidus massiliensis]
MEQIFGHIERITFHNEENGYTVAHIKIPSQKDLVCVVGIMPSIQPGETVRCFGSWKRHLVHGQQFEVQKYQLEAPADLLGIEKYLGSGLINGIGPTYAARIVAKFGIDTLQIIDSNPEKLLEIPGLGVKRRDKIIACWQEQRSIRDVMIFLQTHGISSTYAQKIYKVYGKESIKKILDNPFCLARDIHGIGFKTSDEIAHKLGISKDSPQRIESGIEFLLNEFSMDGHVCYPYEEFVTFCLQQLEVTESHIRDAIQRLKETHRIEIFDLSLLGKKLSFIWLRKYFITEIGIAQELKRLKEYPCQLREVHLNNALDWVQTLLNIELAENQKKAIQTSLCEKVHVITGGPGTGKSTITKAILRITEKLTSHIILAAPTGRAAKRMAEITEKKASTIHSLLEFDFAKGQFKKNKDNPLPCDLIIIDEASMIDTPLMFHLLKAIPSHARVILIGDIHQLPSVGPGNVLKDIINSGFVQVTTLNEIFRQAAESRIVTNAHLINKGQFPDIRNLSDSDFFFVECPNPEENIKQIVSLVCNRLPQKYGYDALQDIQVLSPMKRGIIGIDNLNLALQQKLNPNGESLNRLGRKLLVGDKVMQTRNNYKKEVYNGDVGYIKAIDQIEQQAIIQFDDKEIVYEFKELDEIVLAYAVSIHKYQGSQCPVIIIPVDTSHYILLNRNLIYTGLTRGQKLVIFVGTKKAVALAVKNDEVKKRYTGLEHALIGTLHPKL